MYASREPGAGSGVVTRVCVREAAAVMRTGLVRRGEDGGESGTGRGEGPGRVVFGEGVVSAPPRPVEARMVLGEVVVSFSAS